MGVVHVLKMSQIRLGVRWDWARVTDSGGRYGHDFNANWHDGC